MALQGTGKNGDAARAAQEAARLAAQAAAREAAARQAAEARAHHAAHAPAAHPAEAHDHRAAVAPAHHAAEADHEGHLARAAAKDLAGVTEHTSASGFLSALKGHPAAKGPAAEAAHHGEHAHKEGAEKGEKGEAPEPLELATGLTERVRQATDGLKLEGEALKGVTSLAAKTQQATGELGQDLREYGALAKGAGKSLAAAGALAAAGEVSELGLKQVSQDLKAVGDRAHAGLAEFQSTKVEGKELGAPVGKAMTGLAAVGAITQFASAIGDVRAMKNSYGTPEFGQHAVEFASHLGGGAGSLPEVAEGLKGVAALGKLAPQLELVANSPLLKMVGGLGSIASGSVDVMKARQEMGEHGYNFDNTLEYESGSLKVAGGALMESKYGYELGVGLNLVAGGLDIAHTLAQKSGASDAINAWQERAAEGLGDRIAGVDRERLEAPIKLPPRPAGGWGQFLQTHSPAQVSAYYRDHGVAEPA